MNPPRRWIKRKRAPVCGGAPSAAAGHRRGVYLAPHS
jgi:hypothetical protein